MTILCPGNAFDTGGESYEPPSREGPKRGEAVDVQLQPVTPSGEVRHSVRATLVAPAPEQRFHATSMRPPVGYLADMRVSGHA